uniref:Lectin, mannose binding 2 like n=1 Tax=Equus asinus TaxID=9793 RepID=A0A9L0IC43_EQUAS
MRSQMLVKSCRELSSNFGPGMFFFQWKSESDDKRPSWNESTELQPFAAFALLLPSKTFGPHSVAADTAGWRVGRTAHCSSQAQKRRYSPGVQRVFPYISAMVNNGSLSYDHERDGRPTELGGCTAIVRNLHYDTFLVIRYVKRHLTIMMDIDGKHEWRDCIEVPGVRLPRGYYFGTSSITGDLSDNHDVISLKLFELTVERTPEEERLHRDVFLPSVDNMKLPEMTAPLPPLSGLALFLIVFFSLVFSVFAIVIGIILYNKWQEQSRKRFY